MALGILVLVGKDKKTLQVKFTNAKGKEVCFNIPEAELSASLAEKKKEALAQLEGLEVELEEVGGQPKKVREKGQSFVIPQTGTSISRQPAGARPNPNRSSNQAPATRPGDFHNPYNFIPAPPRKTDHPSLGDSHPVGHGCYHSDRWSGKITVTLTTVTPLLIPDAANLEEDNQGHKTYPVRVGVDGKPYLPPTSIKGMLRSAYEAVTNSRFGVFEKHSDRLAYRMDTKLGLQMVPARIEIDNGGELVISLFPGNSEINDDGTPDDAMYAAWLPRYQQPVVNYVSGQSPQHGEEVEAWIEKFQHHRWDRNRKVHIPDFQYWRVRKIVRLGEQLGNPPQMVSARSPNPNRSYHQPLGEPLLRIRGFVSITNQNIDRKHDERVFFSIQHPIQVNLTNDKLRMQWRELIQNYQEIHAEEIRKGMSGPPALSNSVWSRHIVGGENELNLTAGTLCYAHVERSNNEYIVKALYPVIIARSLFLVAPESLLSVDLRPATQIKDLSPADRVFGWVNQKGKGAYKGNLRISAVTCVGDSRGVSHRNDAIESFPENGLPLAILGQPKPQQARFYLAKDNQGKPLDEGISKQDGYRSDRHLRGRKVYPHHHNLPGEYWETPTEDKTQTATNGHFQEYRRPRLNNQERDDQNRSILGWVKPGVKFSFYIDLTNLSDVELGALLWLLTLPEGYYQRLGGGKPLGFGSVHLKLDTMDLRLGKDWQQFYASLDETLNPKPEAARNTIDQFKQALVAAYGNGKNFEQIGLIQAFVRQAQGFADGKPIHYPRISPEPNPNGEAFKWFVENERTSGFKLPLPELASDRGLPFNPAN